MASRSRQDRTSIAHPFKNLLEPGESIYDLMRAVFPNERLMLKEHFRCVEPIIQFSMQFYPEKMSSLLDPFKPRITRLLDAYPYSAVQIFQRLPS